MDYTKIDFNDGKNFVISRVIQNGDFDDVRTLFAYYGWEEIKKEVVKIKYLDRKTLNMMSLIFNIPKSEFRCFNNQGIF